MRVKVNIVENGAEESAVINTTKITKEITEAKALLENSLYQLQAYQDGVAYSIESIKIYYIESIDNKTFIYTKDNSFEAKLKLYELEELLDSERFIRCSKSMILNIRKIKNIRADLNARFVATLLNDESVVISRSYAKDLKRMLGL